jgi:ABC-type thiamin/hydroxymethylpyrimidine transport system permease subunit
MTLIAEADKETASASPAAGSVYYRLIALWVLCEAMLGGVIHAARIPVSGLIVGSCAVTCICLIAYYVPAGGAIIKATIIVAIFKMMLSPQSPLPAYFAVFFQGLTGELLFVNRKFYRLSCLLLSVLALVESGLQRIVVLTIVYGNNFWKAVNTFLNDLAGQKEFTNYSLMLGSGYVFIHILAGLAVGWWAGIIPSKVAKWKKLLPENYGEPDSHEKIIFAVKRKKRKWLKKGVLVIWIILVLLYLQSHFRIGEPVLPSSLPLQILLRSVIVILAWYFVVSPALTWLLKNWLQKKQEGSQREIGAVSHLLPEMQQMIAKSWMKSAVEKKGKRIILFSKFVLTEILLGK